MVKLLAFVSVESSHLVILCRHTLALQLKLKDFITNYLFHTTCFYSNA